MQNFPEPGKQFCDEAETDPRQTETNQIDQIEKITRLDVDKKSRLTEHLNQTNDDTRRPGDQIQTGNPNELHRHASLLSPIDRSILLTFVSNDAIDQQNIS